MGLRGAVKATSEWDEKGKVQPAFSELPVPGLLHFSDKM